MRLLSKQKHLILIGSLSFSALFAGILVGGLAVWRTVRHQMQDPELLQAQLERISQAGKADQEKDGADALPDLVRVSVAEGRPFSHEDRSSAGSWRCAK